MTIDGVWPRECDGDLLPAPRLAAAAVTGRKRRRALPPAAAGDDDVTWYNGVAVPRAYWVQRSALWHRFASARAPPPYPPGSLVGPIAMDGEGWFSVTPEALATHIAATLCDGAPRATVGILDGCCGCGGNTVAALRHAATAAVLAVDTDAMRLAAVAVNAAVYDAAAAPAAAWPHTAAPSGTPALVLMHASVPALLRKVTSLVSQVVTPPVPPTRPPMPAAVPRDDGLVTLEHVVAATRDAGGVTLTIECPRRCCTAAIPLQVAFVAPPWGGPSYDDEHGAAFDAVARLTLDDMPYPELTIAAAGLFPTSMHYLPRHTDAAGFLDALPAALRAVAHLSLPRLAGRRRPTALLVTLRRPPAPA